MITVIGLDGSPLGDRAAAAVARASLVVGGQRQLAEVPVGAGVATVVLGSLAEALDALAAHEGDAAVLASGDPGFFGIVRALRQRGMSPEVLPAVSCVSQAFARAGLNWDDAQVVSAHGRDSWPALNVCRAYPKVAVLTGPGCGPAEIGAALDGWDRVLVICERLGSPAERVTACRPAEAAGRRWEEPNVVLSLAEATGGGPGWQWPRSPVPAGWALPEECFDSTDAVLTKAEIRALCLARLGPGPGQLVWDVGAGAGSVAVECARFGAAVIAIERDEHRCGLVRDNARRHGVIVRVVAGPVPAALDRLPDPDAVFVGGGGPAVVAAVAGRRPARVVIALAAVERIAPVRTALEAAGYHVQGTMVQAARLAPLPGDMHRLAAVNPVIVLWAGQAGREQDHR
jgi:precorrin-6B C5,15-methyltransferase / cobalt-precorrin-6B C5,C15-methyltransferase